MSELYPTIVIGLGTFGGHVVSNLRTLVFEELGVAGLPIFRFMQITTHQDLQAEFKIHPENLEREEEWEMFHFLKATIPTQDVTRIQTVMEDDDPLSNAEPGWRRWFDGSLAKNADICSVNGAKNIRMLGRACLWNNWIRIQERLTNTIQHITHHQAVDKANEILGDYYARKKGEAQARRENYVDNARPRIYIVGSLCGGTCSGMFLDVAYFFKTCGFRECDIFGMFSIPDKHTSQQPSQKRLCANAMAALFELDFFMHDSTEYSVHLPGSMSEKSCVEKPFKYVQIISPRSRGRIYPAFKVGHNAETDKQTILEMAHVCSSTLFFELLSGTHGQKAAIHTDYYARYDHWNKPNQRGPGYLKGLSTFGAATAHYPKYRIAGGAAASLLLDKILSWTGKERLHDRDTNKIYIKERPLEKQRIKEIADGWLNKAYQNARPEIREASAKINAWINEYDGLFLPAGAPRQSNAQQLMQELVNLPNGNAIASRFTAKGKYAAQISDKLPEFLRAMFMSLKDEFSRALETIVAEQGSASENMPKDLVELMAVVDMVQGELLSEKINNRPTLPSDSVTNGRLRGLADEFQRMENSLSARMVGVGNAGRDYYRQRMIDDFKAMLRQAQASLENGLIATVLDELQREVRVNIGEDMTKLMSAIDKSIRKLEEQYQSLVSLEQWDNLHWVSKDKTPGKNGTPNIEYDVRECAKTFTPSMWPQVFSEVEKQDGGERTVKNIFMNPEEDHEKVISKITDQIVRKLMGRIDMRNFDIIGKLIDDGNNKLTDLALRSEILLELAGNYIDVFGGVHPRLICGGREGSMERLRGNLNRSDIHEFDRMNAVETSIDHMLHFYQEEGGIAIDDLDAYPSLLEHYKSYINDKEAQQRILHTDKDPSKYDITIYHRMTALKNDRGEGKPSPFRIATEFLHDVFFLVVPTPNNSTEYLFEWQESGLRKDAEYRVSQKDLFLAKVATSEAGTDQFKRRIKELLLDMDETDLVQRCNEHGEKIRSAFGRGSKEEQQFQHYFNEAFIKKDGFPWWD